MGAKAGPRIVTSGLVFEIDAAVSRSYSGSGLTSNGLVGGIGGTLVNGVGFSSANGGSFFFDGTNDYMSSSNIDLSSTDKVTVVCWVKVLNYREVNNSSNVVFEFSSNFNSFTTGFVVGFADDSTPSWLGSFPISLAIKGNNGYNIAGFSKTSVNDLLWHHWACLFDKSLSGNENKLYIDGIQLSSILTPLQSDNFNNFGNDKMFIGSRDLANIPANANISQFQIYNRALSAQEILQNYNATKGRYL